MGGCTSKTNTEIQDSVTGTFELKSTLDSTQLPNNKFSLFTSDKLIIKNVDIGATKEEICEYFSTFGNVVHVKRSSDCETSVLVRFAKPVNWYKVYLTLPQELLFKGKYFHIQNLDNNSADDMMDVQDCDGLCYIHNLPNEMLEYIFSYLSIKERIQTERVCKRWRDLGMNLCWRWPTALDLGAIEAFWEEDSLLLTDHIVSSILSRCGKSIKHLELSTKAAHSQLVTRETVVTIGKCCPNLTSITLDDLPEVERCDPKLYLEPLAKGCPNLRYLTIVNTSFTDECLSAYFSLRECCRSPQSESLQTFALVRNDMVVGDCFQDVNEDLRGLRLFGCYRVRPEIAFELLMARCQNIQELSLRYCCETLKPAMLLQILNCYKHTLKILRLDGHGFIPAVWSESISVLHTAEKLSLEKCRGVNDEVIVAFANKCTNLCVLNISGTCVTDAGVCTLAKCCSKLCALNICETQITDAAVSALAVECNHLCALNVSFTGITDDGISVLASALHLKVLDISYTSNVTGIGINDLAEKGQIQELYVRAINRHDNVVQQSCIALSKFCPNFRVLDVRATKKINNTLVDEFRSALHKGLLKGPVYLNVGLTEVQGDIQQSDKLKVCFDPTFRIDFFNKDYFGTI